ncbi:beta-fructosidase [Leptolyngbya sp. BC1307]|uniref:beta-fructosidase n=1 Tax=Leptolyngbya sp. BC1307 TaxID=2029589 RepID=UPI000EFD7C38|nr:beta-fructosidase [Leptolyngbya sp. BC1307]
MPTPPAATQPPCWDPWLLQEDGSGQSDTYRLFYLSGSTDQDPWWQTSWICEAHSQDMCHWHHTGPVLEPLAGQGWESGRIFAGSAYQEENTRYLFYSAASKSEISKEAIGLATSTDGQHWHRFDKPLLLLADDCDVCTNTGIGYAGKCNWASHLHWRDPYILKAPATQKYYLFFCASLTGSALYQGGVGVATADHLAGPYRLLPPVAGPGVVAEELSSTSDSVSDSVADEPADASARWPFYHLERPQVIYFQGKYHLFFSCFKEFVNPLWLEEIGSDNVSDSTLYWYISDQITGPFEPAGPLPVVPGSEATGLYGTTFFPKTHRGNWQQADLSNEIEMSVLGWYSENYRLAVSQEFIAIWTQSGLKIAANPSVSRSIE